MCIAVIVVVEARRYPAHKKGIICIRNEKLCRIKAYAPSKWQKYRPPGSFLVSVGYWGILSSSQMRFTAVTVSSVQSCIFELVSPYTSSRRTLKSIAYMSLRSETLKHTKRFTRFFFFFFFFYYYYYYHYSNSNSCNFNNDLNKQ